MTRSFIHRARMIRWVTVLAITFVASLASAAPKRDPFVAANAAAARGEHAAAAQAFEEVIATDGWSTNALLGLANAYASSGDHGRAVLALERARLLDPRDTAIAENLARIRETAGLTTPTPSHIDRALGLLTADTWSWLSLAGLVVACAGVIGFAWATRRRRISAVAMLGGAVLALGAGVAAYEVPPAPNAVVLVESEQARIAPFAGAEVAFPVRAGEQGHIEQRRGELVYVRIDAERAGWVPDAIVEPIIPSDRRTDAG